MACDWVQMRSSHCPYLVRIESNADFLSRFHGGLGTQPKTYCLTPMSFNQFSVLNQKMLRTKFYFVFITLALYIDFEFF